MSKVTLHVVEVRAGARFEVGPDDRVLYMRSEDDLSLGGEIHTLAVLRAVPSGGSEERER